MEYDAVWIATGMNVSKVFDASIFMTAQDWWTIREMQAATSSIPLAHKYQYTSVLLFPRRLIYAVNIYLTS
jgi:hypothetical protein